MRASLALIALLSCGPLPRAPKCVEPPAPAEDEFAACGGMTHHTGPGPAVPFTIRFTNKMSAPFELTELCVLVDGYSLFAKDKREWSGNLFRGKHLVKVRAQYKRRMPTGVYDYVNPITITIRSASEIATVTADVLEIVAYEQGGVTAPLENRPALRWVKPKDSKCE
jgi:hypothetical protein